MYDGKYITQMSPFLLGYSGVQTAYGLMLPPGSRVAAYVRATGVQSPDELGAQIAGLLVPTLDAGLKRCRAGAGDVVVVLPGHTENVSSATALSSLVAGTRIIGCGQGSNMPAFRWTATAAQWAVSVADVEIAGLRLRLEGANGVVKAINVTGADFRLSGCDVEVASGATAKATIALEIGAGAHRAQIVGNSFRGTATHNATDGILVAGAVNDVRIADNEMIFSATAGNGLVRVNAAALGLRILRNYIYNTHTASTAGIAFGASASSGFVSDNRIGVINTGAITSGTHGISTGATTICVFAENYAVNDPRASAILNPVADT
jgi:hypothetical protein